jgi:putative flippase GtrA
MLNKYKGFIRYNCAAVFSLFTDWLTFLTLNQLGIFFVYNQMIARLVGGLTSFSVNKYWAFQSPEKTYIFLQGRRFMMLFIFSYFLSNYLLYFFANRLGFSIFWVKLMADGVCYITNFFIMKNYVYFSGRSISRSLKDFMSNCLKIN